MRVLDAMVCILGTLRYPAHIPDDNGARIHVSKRMYARYFWNLYRSKDRSIDHFREQYDVFRLIVHYPSIMVGTVAMAILGITFIYDSDTVTTRTVLQISIASLIGLIITIDIVRRAVTNRAVDPAFLKEEMVEHSGRCAACASKLLSTRICPSTGMAICPHCDAHWKMKSEWLLTHPSHIRACPVCGYDLQGIGHGNGCPECGWNRSEHRPG